MIYTTSYFSPLGMLTLFSDGTALTALRFASTDASAPHCPLLEEALRQLEEYFHGCRTRFSLPLAPSGTLFQQKVWSALCRIPYGETRSYTELASMTGNANTCRAVGNANGKNPLPILIPCHRVIRADGSLGGYSAATETGLSGLEIKRYLLKLEQRYR